MLTQYNYDKKLNKFFSEVTTLPVFKKLNLNDYSFKVFIGGKGKGKSYLAFQEMIEQIKKGNIVGYIRNTEIEIKQIKNSIASMIAEQTQFKNLSVSIENIVDKDTNRILVAFISTKNYNKISGNTTPFGMVFYDEFNQDLGSKINKLLFDFFSILQTCFRHNKWNVWACGNTKTRNNIIYNMFKLDLTSIEHNLEILEIDKSILIVRYKDTLFKELNMDSQDLNLIKKYNKSMYSTMIEGVDYEREEELVVNNLENIKSDLVFKKEVIIYLNRVYELYATKDNKYYFWIRNEELKGSIDLINNYKKQGINSYEMELDYGNICGNINKFQSSFISTEMAMKLKKQEVFFNDFPLYLAFKEDPIITFVKEFKDLTK